jgi:TIR domain
VDRGRSDEVVMKVLDSMKIPSAGRIGRIELCQGDLTLVPVEHAVDLVVVSAFPNDYAPTESSLIGAFARKGLSVGQLADRKAVDLRQPFSCWLSEELVVSQGLPYKRVLCFEPLVRGQPPELVGDIFRAIAPFLGGEPRIDSVAMPVVAAGDQGYAIEEMLSPLLEAAFHWMSAGMPLSILKIVVHSDSQAAPASALFDSMKRRLVQDSQKDRGALDNDVFISYSHKDKVPADFIAAQLQHHSVRVFLDRQVLKEGSAWQPDIFKAIDHCRCLVAIYSPAYLESKVCLEEYNIAWARSRDHGTTIVPVYWKSAEIPTYMNMLLYVDCREEVEEKLGRVIERVTELCA